MPATHRTVRSNGINMHIAEQGSGPLVILLHGFPECWYSWRHQLAALAGAGFHAVAPDQRGYCRTDRPEGIDQYSLLHLVGDVIGLMDAMNEERAVVAGHDWGAPVAWSTALMRPDRVRGVIGLSVPYRPRGLAAPLGLLRAALGEGFYQIYFQAPAIADTELASDVRSTFRRLLYSASGDALRSGPALQAVVPTGGGFLDITVEPPKLPAWLTEEDIDLFVEEFAKAGFTGGLNWYRNIDRNWELTAPWQGAVSPATGPVRHRGQGSCRQLPGCPRSDRPAADVRARPDSDRHAAGLRALDAAGAPRRGRRGDDPFLRGL